MILQSSPAVGPAFGIFVIALSALLVVGFTLFRIVKWRLRWGEREWGLRVRVTTALAGNEAMRLVSAIRIARAVFASMKVPFDPCVEIVAPGDVRTETVPDGILTDGTIVGGSIRTERCLPVTPIAHVIVVTNVNAARFFLHEAIAHLLPMLKFEDPNVDHDIEVIAVFEKQAKKELEGK